MNSALNPDIFLIAGEPSGDVLGASLMCGLKAQHGDALVFQGVGGVHMEEQGLESLLPMEELCVMGLWEILSHLPRLNRLITGLCEEIEFRKPKVVVTIDLPDFNFRVAERLKKRGIFQGKIVHYVAPSVWAWRPGRAKHIAKFLDGLMCLFPFEPEYFTKVGLKAAYVGHPLIEIDKDQIDRDGYRQVRGIGQDDLCIGVFFGSREAELKAMSQVFCETIEYLAEHYPKLIVIAPTLPRYEMEVMNIVKGIGVESVVDPDTTRKWNAFAACDLAIAVSGTVGLELAYLGVPHIIGYKAHPVSAVLFRILAKVKHVHLANILLGREAVPEFLQGRCNALEMTKAILRLIRKPEAKEEQLRAFDELAKALQTPDGKAPSANAASFVSAFLTGKEKAAEAA